MTEAKEGIRLAPEPSRISPGHVCGGPTCRIVAHIDRLSGHLIPRARFERASRHPSLCAASIPGLLLLDQRGLCHFHALTALFLRHHSRHVEIQHRYRLPPDRCSYTISPQSTETTNRIAPSSVRTKSPACGSIVGSRSSISFPFVFHPAAANVTRLVNRRAQTRRGNLALHSRPGSISHTHGPPIQRSGVPIVCVRPR